MNPDSTEAEVDRPMLSADQFRKHRAQKRILQSVVLLGRDVSEFEETILAKPAAETEPKVVLAEEEKTETKVVFSTDDEVAESKVPDDEVASNVAKVNATQGELEGFSLE